MYRKSQCYTGFFLCYNFFGEYIEKFFIKILDKYLLIYPSELSRQNKLLGFINLYNDEVIDYKWVLIDDLSNDVNYKTVISKLKFLIK